MTFLRRLSLASWTLLSPSAHAAADVDWDSLSSQLSSSVEVTSVQAWLEQCVKPFDAVAVSENNLAIGGVSNYDLFEQDSGLCMQCAGCAFEGCRGIFWDRYADFTGKRAGAAFYQSAETDLYATLYPDGSYPVLTDREIVDAAAADSELPEAVVHPRHPGDISRAVRFAAESGLGISVKTSGHNWMGAATKKGTLLLNLSKLKKFALPETLSEGIFECPAADDNDGNMVDPPKEISLRKQADIADPNEEDGGSVAAACKLAIARGKPAVMRAGGGQIVDEGLRTMEAWNNGTDRRQYHAMTGAAGTVSLAGGWLFSGGLGGTLNMRKYGIGVDQVLHVEMVLPDGRFVRFGPSAWRPAEGDQLYPQTTEVTGFCNEGDLSDEGSWSWVKCDDEYDFANLWFAIRGGAGGSYGVITSIYYQLHDKPGTYQTIDWFSPIFAIVTDPNNTDEAKADAIKKIHEFLFTFLYNPSKIGIPADVSNSCSSPDNPTLGCYDGAGQHFVDAWAQYGNGLMPLTVAERSSYASSIPNSDYAAGHPWNDRISDSPPGNILFGGPNAIVFPIDVLKNKFDEFMAIYVPCVINSITALLTGADFDDPLFCMVGTPYFYGGDVQFASDGMDAYPPHRRNGAFHVNLLSDNVREQVKRLFWDVPADDDVFAGETFPGIYCHNHMYATTSPRKSNWLEECDSQRDGTPLSDDDCMSLQEAAFGTENLRRLENIHAEIDPDRMFQAVDGPGYASSGGGGDVSGGDGDDEDPAGAASVEDPSDEGEEPSGTVSADPSSGEDPSDTKSADPSGDEDPESVRSGAASVRALVILGGALAFTITTTTLF